jgi:hypothetical protein
MKIRLHLPVLLRAPLALALLAAAHAAEPSTSTIKFSDVSRPGTLKVQIARGDLRIQGTDTPEVAVTSEIQAVTSQPRKDGLRVLTATSSFSLTEKDNVVTLDALSDGYVGAGADFAISVPRSTNIVVQNSYGGDITCRAIAGDVEINSMNGAIRLDGVSGGIVVQTMNGEISANILELQDAKPLSFSSMNGEVTLRVPQTARANLRFRTQNGSVLTDFPEAALVTRTEGSAKPMHSGGGVLPPEARMAIREAGRIAAETAREVEAAVREAAQAAREGAEATRGAEAPRAPKPPRPAVSPKPPKMPMIPPLSGGKLLTGVLNGGGAEINVATMNGDVTLRQTASK